MSKYIIMLFMAIFILNSCSVTSDKINTNTKVQNSDKYTQEDLIQEETLLGILNEVRAKDNNCSQAAPRLILDKRLTLAAKKHAKDMALNHFVRHDGSGTETDEAKKKLGIGSLFTERLVYFGFRAPKGTISGENVVKIDILDNSEDIYSNFKKALNGILHSKTQCQILMNPEFKYVGIGYYNDNNSYYWTIDYAQEKSE